MPSKEKKPKLVFGESVVCPRCYGDPKTSVGCPVCHGKGVVPNKGAIPSRRI